MRNLLERKPSLTELTGISNSRLQRFVHHLRTYLVGSISTDHDASNTTGQSSQSPTLLASKSCRVRSCSIVQGSLSPRPSSFKEGMPRNLASLRNVVRDKLRRRVEGAEARLESSEKHPLPSPPQLTESKLSESLSSSGNGICLFPSLSGKMQIPSIISAAPLPTPSSIFSPPYYCWCPPVVSTLQYMVTPPHTTTESFTLPPLSSLLSAPKTSSEIPLPPFLPLSMPASQLFTPLMCDPIVHIPVIDLCSSGQAYLVSASPAISISIPPLHSPLVKESDSEKSARDTLRMLLSGSSQFPSDNILGGGSMGFYGATTDVTVNVNVNAIANSIAAMSLVSPGVMRRCIDQGDLVDLLKEPVDTGGTSSCSNEDCLSEGSTE